MAIYHGIILWGRCGQMPQYYLKSTWLAFAIQKIKINSKGVIALLSFTLNNEAKPDNVAKSKINKKKKINLKA